MFNFDHGIIEFDKALRTVAGVHFSARPGPGDQFPEADLSESERRHAAALMRVNHCGEVCAQALYQGQALGSRSDATCEALEQAAREEIDHLAWSERRIAELGGHASVLNPLWFAGSFAIGYFAGILGDRWNLGFLAETERQVEQHLEGHLRRLAESDVRTRAIIEAMKRDEAGHADAATRLGARELPDGARRAMRVAALVMTTTSYWV